MKYLLCLILCACSPTALGREACYAQNEAHATARAIGECRGAWNTCPARPEILKELSESHAKCP